MSVLSALRRRCRRLGATVSDSLASPDRDDAVAMGITREHLIWAYRLFLDRDAGPLDDLEGKIAVVRSTGDLRAAFLGSPEYEKRNLAGVGFIPPAGRAIAELPGDLRLFVDLADRMVGINILRGRYEVEETSYVRRCVAAGDHVLDIGANIGYFTIQMADWVGSTGSVVAFEPVPANLELLRKSVTENGFEERVQIVEAVAADSMGEAEILTVPVRHSFNSGGAHIVRSASKTPIDHQNLRVRQVQIDRHPMPRPVSFMKVDAEGAEALVLRGARELLLSDRPLVLAEINPDLLQRVSGIGAEVWIAEMAQLGFECRLLKSDRPGKRIRSVEGIANVVFMPVKT